ncbi:hypothetical protein AOB46_13710 [Chryseobacterium indologenes]|uniref:Uncharacterized protein n=2 Tax=Chryseobacterium indologenes TaxID=253 RepID=A0A0N0ZVW0_CHRID|nr:hypothetical protein AOB46_13710 [Chryseobacterium indologenes]
MLLGLAFSNNNAHTVTDNNGQNPVTVQSDGGGGAGLDPGEPGEPVGGNSGQLPPPPQPKP